MQTLKNKNLTVDTSEFGAELQSIRNTNGKEYLWQGIPEIWNGRSPVLFPIVGRIKNDTLSVDGKEYTLNKHGFARKSEFEVVKITETSVSYMLKSNAETKNQYPYDFEFYIHYELVNNTVSVTYEVKNTDKREIYFSLGAHPGFNCKMGDFLEFENNETLETYVMNEDAYITKKIPYLTNENRITITEDIFKNDALMFENTSSKSITLKSNDDFSVCVKYYNARFLGLWAKPGAPYVCIEPWFGINDFENGNADFKNKYGILSVETGKTFKYKMDIEIN